MKCFRILSMKCIQRVRVCNTCAHDYGTMNIVMSKQHAQLRGEPGKALTARAPDAPVSGAAEEVERRRLRQREGAARRQRQRRQGARQRPARLQQLLQAASCRQQAPGGRPCTPEPAVLTRGATDIPVV